MAGRSHVIFVAFLAALLTGSWSCLVEHAAAPARPIARDEFARLMADLSEPEGRFDSDNFVSNEAGYLRILSVLRRRSLIGGAYLGVGPDQNYSYIAEMRPDLAFIVDIRRQNLLQHLYFKALFALSRNRLEFLEHLFGREVASPPDRPEDLGIGALLDLFDGAVFEAERARLRREQAEDLLRSWNLGLDDGDFATIRYVASAFAAEGANLRFSNRRRPPRPRYPTYRNLLEATDADGVPSSYLAEESRYRTVKDLHARNRIIPVVGDFAGAEALRKIGNELRRRGAEVRVFYVSNVEFYLFRQGRWDAFVQNLRSLPMAADAHIIRSYSNTWRPHPAAMPGDLLTTVMQSVRDLLSNEDAGRNLTYWEMATRDCVPR